MKKIVDINYFTDPGLEIFFKKNSSNIAVITSISAIEAYRKGPPKEVLNLFRTFSKFPNQVLFLEHTKKVITLKPSSRNMQRRMIDENATKEFKSFINQISFSREPSNAISLRLNHLHAEANRLMKQAAEDMDGIASSLRGFSQSLTQEQLGKIRRGEQFDPELAFKIISQIFALSKNLYDRENPWKEMFDYSSIRNTYQFRLSICSYLLVLRWLKDGKTHAGKLEHVRNDVVDLTYVAFATFFDGLLTRDKKMNELYERARYMLNKVLVY